jgi:hypothetical protein
MTLFLPHLTCLNIRTYTELGAGQVLNSAEVTAGPLIAQLSSDRVWLRASPYLRGNGWTAHYSSQRIAF